MEDRLGTAMLRKSVAHIEQRYRRSCEALYLQTGLSFVDTALKGGLRRGVIHEFMGKGHDRTLCARPTRFIAHVLSRTAGPVIWVTSPGEMPILNGLRQAGLSAERLLCLEVDPERMAGTVEDVLRSKGVLAVVADMSMPLSLTASRRLALAGETYGVTGFLLHRHERFVPPSACWTRWRIAAAPSALVRVGCRTLLPFPKNFSLTLLRHRGGDTLDWRVGTDHVTPPSFALASALAHNALAQGASASRSDPASGVIWA